MKIPNSVNDVFSRYTVPAKLQKLTVWFIVSSIIYLLVAGSLAILMRLIQSKTLILEKSTLLGTFYTSLTIHGQLMFFGFISMLTIGISYYFVSKFGRKNLYSFRFAVISFALMNLGSMLLIVSGLMLFGGGWYNLMPLPFNPGNNGWDMNSAIIFLIADLVIGIGITIFTVNVILTLFSGNIAVQILGNKKNTRNEYEVESVQNRNITKTERIISLIGINSWFPTKKRKSSPIVPIILVGVFVNCVAQLTGNVGLFLQLYDGFAYVFNPGFEPDWLLAKNFWWFFGHPIVYFTLFSFLGAAYYYIPKYANIKIPYDRWAYRPWPFYLTFTVMVFSHHVFMDMPNPTMMQYMSQFASFAIAFPSGLTLMTILLYLFRAKIRWNITSMFMLVGIAGWVFGGFAGIQTGWWGENIYLHNTLHVVGHIHFVILMGSVPLALGLIYSIIPQITKKSLNKSLGLVHFISLTLGGFGLSFLFTYLGYNGMVRRIADVPADFAWAMPYLNFFALTVGFGMIVFAFNLFKTLKHKRKS